MNVSLGGILLQDFNVEMRLEYRLGRRIEAGSDGDDIILEGRKSYEFSLMGKLTMEQLKQIEKEIANCEPVFQSEFGEFKVAVKSLVYRSHTGETAIELVEDIS